MPRPPLPRAFTLIELLVVISIISVLVALILPSLGKAREIAVQTSCSANLRQVGIAMANYIADFKETYPEPYATRYTATGAGRVQTGLFGFSGTRFDTFATPTNLIWDYSSSKLLFKCPTDEMFVTHSFAGVTVTSISYGMSVLAATTIQPGVEGRVTEGSWYFYGSPYPDWNRSIKSSQVKNTRAVLYAETNRWDGRHEPWFAYRSDFVHPSAGSDSYYLGNGRPQQIPATITVMRNAQAHPTGMNIVAMDGSGRFEVGYKDVQPLDIADTWYVR